MVIMTNKISPNYANIKVRITTKVVIHKIRKMCIVKDPSMIIVVLERNKIIFQLNQNHLINYFFLVNQEDL